MNKYYTPEIEEFHVGFEYEEKDIEWEKAVCGTYDAGDFDALGDVSREGNIRVKHLDREDIESLGFNHIGAMWFESEELNCRIRKWTGLGVDVYSDWSRVELDGDHPNNHRNFSGAIKNKSELKRILKQIGV